MYRNMDIAHPGTPSLATSYTTPFYRRFGWSTLRNSSALELLVYLAIGWSVPESLYFHVHTGVWCSLASCFWSFVWLACLLWFQAGYAVKTPYLLLRETLTFSSSEITCLFCIPSVCGPLPPPYMGSKLVSDVSAPPDFRKC